VITEVSPNASVKLDGSGGGQVSLTPPSGTVWRLRLAAVSTTSTAKQPQAFLYRGSSSGPVEQIDSTYLGNSASSGKVAGAPFFPGQVLWAVWKGGDAGAVATLQAYGQQGGRSDPFDSGPVGEGFPLSVATVFQAGNTIVINSAGEFVYSGVPGAGNLVASIAPGPGTDPYGNAYLAGFASYFGTNTIQMNAGELDFLLSSALQAFIGTVAHGIQLTGGTNTDAFLASLNILGGAAAQIIASPSVLAQDPNVAFTQAESWHPLTLQNGWANRGAGFIPARYRLLASPPNTVEIEGNVSSGTIANGTVLANLPATAAGPYRPAKAQSVAVQGALGTTAHSPLDPVIEAETNGDLKLFNIGAGTTSVSFHGLISLDA
jgi:hypothetical protein